MSSPPPTGCVGRRWASASMPKVVPHNFLAWRGHRPRLRIPSARLNMPAGNLARPRQCIPTGHAQALCWNGASLARGTPSQPKTTHDFNNASQYPRDKWGDNVLCNGHERCKAIVRQQQLASTTKQHQGMPQEPMSSPPPTGCVGRRWASASMPKVVPHNFLAWRGHRPRLRIPSARLNMPSSSLC